MKFIMSVAYGCAQTFLVFVTKFMSCSICHLQFPRLHPQSLYPGGKVGICPGSSDFEGPALHECHYHVLKPSRIMSECLSNILHRHFIRFYTKLRSAMHQDLLNSLELTPVVN